MPAVDKTRIEERVADWKLRINNLYTLIQEWLVDTDYKLKTGPKQTMYEPLMEEFGVLPTEVNTADIYKGKKKVLAVIPKGLWIIGANGRIDLLSGKGASILVDFAKPLQQPEWKIYVSTDRRHGINFNKNAFLNALKQV